MTTIAGIDTTQENAMYKTLLVPVNIEDTRHSQHAIKAAVAIAQRDGAALHVLTVLPGFGMPLVASFFPADAMREAKKEVAKRLHDYVAQTVPDSVKTTPKIMEGNPPELIVEYAEAIGADLIVMPPHDRGSVNQAVLGSCTMKVAQHAHCSVMVVRG
jgi:nucleotide-binding universal stress UspA family protein